MESETLSIATDFERGDRAFFEEFGKVQFATVIEANDSEVAFQLDEGGRVFTRLNPDPQSMQDIAEWKKPLPLYLVEAGSRISIFAPDHYGQSARWYANVVEHVPGEKVVLGYDDLDASNSTYSVKNKTVSLEHYMREWELEG